MIHPERRTPIIIKRVKNDFYIPRERKKKTANKYQQQKARKMMTIGRRMNTNKCISISRTVVLKGLSLG